MSMAEGDLRAQLAQVTQSYEHLLKTCCPRLKVSVKSGPPHNDPFSFHLSWRTVAERRPHRSAGRHHVFSAYIRCRHSHTPGISPRSTGRYGLLDWSKAVEDVTQTTRTTPAVS
jgi:hypothetical protein